MEIFHQNNKKLNKIKEKIFEKDLARKKYKNKIYFFFKRLITHRKFNIIYLGYRKY